MEITELVWKLFLILLPGVVSTLMIRYITTKKNFSVFEFAIYSSILGIATFVVMEILYSCYSIIIGVFSSSHTLTFGLSLSIWDNLLNGEKSFNKNEIFISYLLAVPMGFIWGFVITKKVFISLFQKLKFTNRYGDNDVWSFYLNSPSTDWVYLHNRKENLTYFGKIRAYSDSEEKREILLEDVIVYASDIWQELYQANATYLELNNYDYCIESPKLIENGKNSEN